MDDIRDLIKGQVLNIDGTTLTGCDNNDIYDLVIPEGITTISEYAFCEFKNLYSVQLPKSLVTIDECAFVSCKNLAKVNFSAATNLTTIGKYAFLDTSLTEINLPESLRIICEGAFSNAYRLKRNNYTYLSAGTVCLLPQTNLVTPVIASVCIPKNTFVEQYAFTDTCMQELLVKADKIAPQAFSASKVRNVIWDSEATSLAEYAFCNCNELSSFAITVHAAEYLHKIESYAFHGCSSLFEFTATDNVEVIGDNAFGLSGIRKFNAGIHLRNIGVHAFEQAPLREIDLTNTEISRIGPQAFMETELTSLYANPKETIVLDNIVEKCKNLNFLNVGADVSSVYFTGCSYGNRERTTIHLCDKDTKVNGQVSVPFVILQSKEQADSITVADLSDVDDLTERYIEAVDKINIIF